MKTKLLNIQDELSIAYDAYEGLQVILAGSSTDAEQIIPILTVINEKLKRVMDELNKARKEPTNTTKSKTRTIIPFN